MRRFVEEQLAPLRSAFERLTHREQLIVVGGGVGGFFIVMLGIGLLISSAIGSAEHRVNVKLDTLQKVLALEGEYRARELEQKRSLDRLKRNKGVRLISLVENAARQAGVDIGGLEPEEGEPNDEGIVEARVELRASKLSVDRLQDFLSRIQKTPGMIFIRRLQVNKPYRKDTLDVELVVSTYKAKS